MMTRSRKKTTTEPVAMPYRHGILHGRDLAYDTKIVAAKCWAALFALREWALAVRDGELEEPAPEPEKSLLETLRDYAEVEALRARLETWEPRDPEILAEVPRSGPPEDFEQASPERTLSELFHYWKQKNYGFLAELLHLPADDRPIGPRAQEMRELLGDKELVGFRILEIRDIAAAQTAYEVEIDYLQDDEELTGSLELRLLHLDEEGMPLLRGEDRGRWLVAGLHLGANQP